jgi:deoxyribonuclease V
VQTKALHSWNVTPAEARGIQIRLAPQVVRDGAPQNVRLVAAADISVRRELAFARGAVVLMSYPEMEVVEVSVVEDEPRFPYVPGLLTFREAPILLRAFEQLQRRPDLLLVDGQGLAHPRRLGIACHLGLLLDLPAIGCAKSRLCGEYLPPDRVAGSRTPLLDGDEVIGSVLRTRDATSPLFVSIGHRIGLEEAVEWVLRCCRGHRLPEPSRAAHMAAGGHLDAWRATVAGAGQRQEKTIGLVSR